MSERRAPRLAVEVAFLAALAAALTFADLRPYEIAGVMALGWVVVAVFEWGAFRSRPHYRRGLPPQWYVPPLELPPPRPLEQFVAGYPAAEPGADEVTWIAPAALHADWPIAAPDAVAAVAVVDETTRLRDPVEELEQVEPTAEPEPVLTAPPPPEPEPADEEPELPPPPEPGPAPPLRATPVATGRTATHTVDPLTGPGARKSRRLGRRPAEQPDTVEVAWRPAEPWRLPARHRGGGE